MGLADTTALEDSMKLAQLDTMRGYAQDNYAVVCQSDDAEHVPRESARGYQVLREPSWNKG
jgi:malate dehydrogenase (oxaloacetate-decarboxylating)(NADP+)